MAIFLTNIAVIMRLFGEGGYIRGRRFGRASIPFVMVV